MEQNRADLGFQAVAISFWGTSLAYSAYSSLLWLILLILHFLLSSEASSSSASQEIPRGLCNPKVF
jgi:hypothetical protein